MLPTEVLRFLAWVVGGSLHVSLAVILARKRNASLADRLLLASLATIGLWQVAGVARAFLQLGGHTGAATVLEMAGRAGLALAPSVVLHLALVWSGMTGWLAVPGYALAPLMWRWLEVEAAPPAFAWLAANLATAAVACLYRAQRSVEAQERLFFRVLAAAFLAVPLVGVAADGNAASLAWAAAAPAAVLAFFIYRYNVLHLVIGKRVVFALNVGVLFAVYLGLVNTIVNYVVPEGSLLRSVAPVVLIFAAGLIWLPLYGWMTRFFAKRTHLYTDFSKRMVEEAARILDLRQRLQFLASELGRLFGLRRVLIALSEEPDVRGEFGSQGATLDSSALAQLAELAREGDADMSHRDRAKDAALRALLTRFGFNYVFSLRYEGRLTGLLLLDTSPRIFLDENEPILAGLSDQISHSIATCRAIEDKISLERTLVQQEHLASLGKVAATIAHEIKNPLSSIKTLAQLMREDEQVASRYSRDLGYMIGETERLNRSVQQLLSFSRPVAEKKEEIDLAEMLESMTQFLSREHEREGIRIECNVAQRIRLRGISSEAIKQIVLNLLLNAVQATPSGSAVSLEASEAGGQVVIAVSDCGPGIPADIREKIFEPFFTTKQKGTGLGLSIVRKNVRHLGGEIRLESPLKEGRGTRMAVTLPA